MFGFRPKLPVTEDERLWLEEGFRRLEKSLGRRPMLDATVILPTEEFFPDPYNKTPATAEMLFRRVCNYMKVDRKSIDIEIFPDETEELRELLPYWNGNSNGCAGLFSHKNDVDVAESKLVAIRSTQLQDPISLVATFAHELGHVILIGGGLIDPKTPDHEPLTDLLTVYLGLGIFTANSAARFRQYQDERRAGWSMNRLGYLPEEAYGYALAKFATARAESRPVWAKYLSANVASYLKKSKNWMEMQPAL